MTENLEEPYDIGDFNELAAISWRYWRRLLETYSTEQLEKLLCSAPKYPFSSESDKELFRLIMGKRYHRLNSKFKWTDENKKRIIKASDEFLKAWEDGFAKAKVILDALYEKEQDKNYFKDKYDLEIVLYPEFLSEEYDTIEIYEVITTYLNPRLELKMAIEYDPATKSEENFRQNTHICRDESWNIHGFGDVELADHYICYALYILYYRNNWAFEDILKINNISAEIKVSYFDFNGKF